MKLAINKKEYDFKFGARFVNDLDNHFGMQMSVEGAGNNQNFAVSFGMALTRLIPAIAQDDAGAIAKVLYSAGAGNRPTRPSMDDIFDYLDSCDNYEKLCDEIRTELEQSNVTKGKVLGLVENKEK